MSAHARPLAVQLAGATESQLAALFRARGVRADAGWQDFFDAAEALLEPASIERALPTLTLDEARTLRRAAHGEAVDAESPAAEHLIAIALLQADGTSLPPVAEAVAALPEPIAAVPEEPAPSSQTAAAHAAERAFTTVGLIADLLISAADRPIALLADGRVAAGEKRRLADAGMPADLIDDLVATAVEQTLLTRGDRRLGTSRAGRAWLPLSAADRWRVLASGFQTMLPRALSTAEGGWLPPADWERRRPWDPAWPERAAQLLRRAELLGLIAGDGSEPAWSTPLRHGEGPDTAAIEALFPTEVDRVFLQNDLSAISPGPLAPELDVRLRTMTERESAAQASTYRFTAASITGALTEGATEESLLGFLEELSLTGIPQPLRYLITQTAQRHGLIRISADADGVTRVSSVDQTLLETLAVDQTLRHLGLTRTAHGLTSRVGRDTVFWALSAARYPAVVIDESGDEIAVDRVGLSPVPDDEPDFGPLIERLRSSRGPDADAAWLERELDAAVRSRAVLRVEVAMPDGTSRELLLEATGLGGGRLRGRDRAADVERTLPVRSIRSAAVVTDAPA